MASSKTVIREITDPAEFARSAKIIRASFRPVADEFGLTRQNTPMHGAFTTVWWLKRHKRNGATFFGLFEGGQQIGFIAVEASDEGPWWLEKLAVLPASRHSGHGAKLIGHAIDYIRSQGADKVRLGMMNEHTVLKNWYLRLGFKEVSRHTYPNFPFTMCMMERDTAPLTTPARRASSGG